MEAMPTPALAVPYAARYEGVRARVSYTHGRLDARHRAQRGDPRPFGKTGGRTVGDEPREVPSGVAVQYASNLIAAPAAGVGGCRWATPGAGETGSSCPQFCARKTGYIPRTLRPARKTNKRGTKRCGRACGTGPGRQIGGRKGEGTWVPSERGKGQSSEAHAATHRTRRRKTPGPRRRPCTRRTARRHRPWRAPPPGGGSGKQARRGPLCPWRTR